MVFIREKTQRIVDNQRFHAKENAEDYDLDQVRNRKNASGIRRNRIILQKCIQRHQEHRAEEADQEEYNRHQELGVQERNQQQADGRTQSSPRHKSRFNKVLGCPRHNKRAEHQTEYGKDKAILEQDNRIAPVRILLEDGHKNLDTGPENGNTHNASPNRRKLPGVHHVTHHGRTSDRSVFTSNLRNEECKHGRNQAHRHKDPRPGNRLAKELLHRRSRIERRIHRIQSRDKKSRKDKGRHRKDLEERIGIA